MENLLNYQELKASNWQRKLPESRYNTHCNQSLLAMLLNLHQRCTS